ncbi:protein COFACTOR ASSEMBLY OF COMPLEX C SUBUNIT B CCB4, chloroplastic isoform X2 [Mangifera indica]|uniref:protein COFACTOR ASSEMBLY OF COMPLEX C SUBUNIT B CCB4, chloroplastic isoform X2 n=1 Tax=Mangifera indica TaxID=29780 RepID=UPI001CFB4D12|nr:protein COFACTOR ASSEMBLY OF COMPLEX C SUBUNIT B CCB4, chloroplastic isoform X2 [Mangifera indica]
MEAGNIFYTTIPWNLKRSFTRNPCNFRRFIRASANLQSQRGYKGPKPSKDWVADWVTNNDDTVRSLPIYVGGVSLLAVLFNRTVSGIAPVADASRSCLVVNPAKVHHCGVECRMISSHLPDFIVSELLWAWESLSSATCSRSLVVVYDSICILQIGVAAQSPNDGEVVTVDVGKLMQGSVYQGVMRSGTQSYLANLFLYPGRSELPFLPSNTQAVILQPLGDKGLAIIGGDTIRGFTTSDQSWIAFIGEKLDATLAKYSNTVSLVVEDGISK